MNSDGSLPMVWLIIEWFEGADQPTGHWLSTLPEQAAIAELTLLGRIRWRVEHDYRELKHRLLQTRRTHLTK